jgi:4-amino-4-deoxy-L-arabinose transferase-like glycosyltransferase
MVAIAVLWFGGLEYRGLFYPDEGRYAEIPREMLASGDWVTPRLNDLKYFEKPPLQYWMTALSFAAFGQDEWTARLWPATAGFLGMLLLAFAGNRTGPPGAGYVGALVLATSISYFLASQYLTLDMGLTFFLSAALCAFLLAQDQAPRGGRAARLWMLAAWASLGCAVLAKGLVGIVLPGLALLAYVLIKGDGSLLRRLAWVKGSIVFLAIVLPWHVLVQVRNPEFFSFYVVHEHIQRFLSPEHHRPGPWWYLAVIALLGALPWTPLLPGAIARAIRQRSRAPSFDADTFLLLWIAAILVFFSMSASKLPAYILPLMPALALLLGRDIARRGTLEPKWAGLLLALAGAAALFFGLPQIVRAMNVEDLVYAYYPWFLGGLVVLVAGGLAAWGARAAGAMPRFMALALASLAGAQILLSGLHEMDDQNSAERFVEQLLGEDRGFARNVPFYSIGHFDESLAFYLARPLTLVAHRGELGPGIEAEPGKYVDSVEEFKRRWAAEAEAYAAMKPQQYAAFRGDGLPMRVLALNGRRVIVSRDQPEPPLQTKALGKVLALLQAGQRRQQQ